MMSLGMMEFLVIGAVVLGLILGLLVLTKISRGQTWTQGGAQSVKSKRRDDPYLTQLEEQGALHLEDDGELPELGEDDLYLEDKPKRLG